MFRIGEFSKITQVAGSQLRYYDEIGLLNPAKIDDGTGYRYYSAQQISRLNRILALKGLGLSLDQIRRMLDDNISADEIRGMFTLKKAQVEQTVREELTRLQHIEARLQQIDDGHAPADYEIIVKSIPELTYLSMREIMPSFDHARGIIAEMQRALPKSTTTKSLGPLTAIMHEELFEEADIDLEMGFVLNGPQPATVTLPSGRMMAQRILPAVAMMATAVRIGQPQTAYNCRATLASWVETNGYEFAGNGRELFLVPPRPGKENETVLEIQYPIKQAGTGSPFLN